MHLCRESFPTLLDTKGLLYDLVSSSFACSKFLYDDLERCARINNFINYIYSKYKESHLIECTEKTPQALLASVGYKLYECHTLSELEQFRKYYTHREMLCTFGIKRLQTHHIFFAVKDNALELNRNDFPNPLREDEYSTSVISIQFTKGLNNRISIKSRYNHSVDNPDATFYNNLENIVPGLTRSFEQHYGFNINSYYSDDFYLENYTKARDGRYYRYNAKVNNIYYCIDNNIISNGYPLNFYLEKEKYLLVDYLVIDFENKKIFFHDQNIIDGFIDLVSDISKIDIINNKEEGIKYICITSPESEMYLGVNKYNQIVSYYNDYVDKIGDNFLIHNTTMQEISLPNVTKIGKYFLCFDNELRRIYAPKVKTIGECSLISNHDIEEMELPSLKNQEFIRRRKKVNVNA